MNLKRIAIPAVGLGLALAVATPNKPFSFDAPTARAQATPSPTVTSHIREHSKVVGSRKATKAEVASGFAASTLSTVYICSSGANLKDPIYDTVNSATWIGIGWDESSDANGTPDARIHSGSAPLYVHNNKTYGIYWSAAQWENDTSGGLLYQWVRWYYNQTALNYLNPNGGGLGMQVLSDGNASSQGTVWYNQEHHANGFETWIAWSSTAQFPAVDITLWGSGSHASDNSLTEVEIRPTNGSPCGDLYTRF